MVLHLRVSDVHCPSKAIRWQSKQKIKILASGQAPFKSRALGKTSVGFGLPEGFSSSMWNAVGCGEFDKISSLETIRSLCAQSLPITFHRMAERWSMIHGTINTSKLLFTKESLVKMLRARPGLRARKKFCSDPESFTLFTLLILKPIFGTDLFDEHQVGAT